MSFLPPFSLLLVSLAITMPPLCLPAFSNFSAQPSLRLFLCVPDPFGVFPSLLPEDAISLFVCTSTSLFQFPSRCLPFLCAVASLSFRKSLSSFPFLSEAATFEDMSETRGLCSPSPYFVRLRIGFPPTPMMHSLSTSPQSSCCHNY